MHAPLPGRVGGGGATSPHPQAGVRATRTAQRAGEAVGLSSLSEEGNFYFFVILDILFTFFFPFRLSRGLRRLLPVLALTFRGLTSSHL